jgi:amino acid transporter
MPSISESGKGLPDGVFSRGESTKNEQLGRQESIEIAGQVQELQADQALEHLGYAPELSRNRSTFHVAFMSFVLASMPYGLATTLFYPLINGGSATVIWGFGAVSLIIICVACSLGEITSVYPTAGGVYYQTFMLSPVRWRRLAAWICGWAYVAGNVVITLAVSFGTTSFVVACINVFEMEPGLGIFQASTYQIYLLFLAITVLCTATSAFGNRHLPKLDVRALALTHCLSD